MQLARVAGGRLLAPRAPRSGGRIYTPDDVMLAPPPQLGLGLGLGHPYRPPAQFEPTWITDLSGWWSMKLPADRSVTAGRVTQLNDKSGLVRHLTEVGGSGLTEQLAGWNGKPCMLANGVNMYLEGNAVGADFSGLRKPLTLIAAVEGLDVGVQFALGKTLPTTTPFTEITRDAGPDLNVQRRDNAGVLKGALGGAPFIGRTVISIEFDGKDVWTWLKSVPDLTGADLDVGETTLNQFTIACYCRGNLRANFANARYTEFMIYKRALTATERQDCEGYLIGEWGVS